MNKEPPKKRARQLRQVDGQLNLIDFFKRTSVGKPGHVDLHFTHHGLTCDKRRESREVMRRGKDTSTTPLFQLPKV